MWTVESRFLRPGHVTFHTAAIACAALTAAGATLATQAAFQPSSSRFLAQFGEIRTPIFDNAYLSRLEQPKSSPMLPVVRRVLRPGALTLTPCPSARSSRFVAPMLARTGPLRSAAGAPEGRLRRRRGCCSQVERE